MPGGRPIFYFVEKEPVALWVVGALLFANTFLSLFLGLGRGYIGARHLPSVVYWYSEHDILIQWVLLAALAAIFVIYRKRVHYAGRR